MAPRDGTDERAAERRVYLLCVWGAIGLNDLALLLPRQRRLPFDLRQAE